MNLYNLAIKTSDKNTVLSLFKKQGLSSYLSTHKDWIMLFPEAMDETDDKKLQKFLAYITDKLQTIATRAMIYDSDDLFFHLYDKGELVLDYMACRTIEDKITIYKGSAETIMRYSQKETSLREIEDILKSKDLDKYVFVENRYRDLLTLLGMPKALGDWSYDYIFDTTYDKGERKSLQKDLPTIEKL